MLDHRSLLVSAGLKEAAIDTLVAQLGSYAQITGASAAELRAGGVPRQLSERLASAFEFARVATSTPRENLGQAVDVYEILRPRIAHLSQEVFYVLAVDMRNGLIDAVEVARGTVCGVEVHPREVFRPAIRLAAAGIVLAHNHPSGDPTPSAEDVALTRRLREIGSTLGIPVIDHVVVATSGYRSIAEWLGSDL